MRGGLLHLILWYPKVRSAQDRHTWAGVFGVDVFALWCLGGQASSPFVYSLCHHQFLFGSSGSPGPVRGVGLRHALFLDGGSVASPNVYFQLYNTRPPVDDEAPKDGYLSPLYPRVSKSIEAGGGGGLISLCVFCH